MKTAVKAVIAISLEVELQVDCDVEVEQEWTADGMEQNFYTYYTYEDLEAASAELREKVKRKLPGEVIGWEIQDYE